MGFGKKVENFLDRENALADSYLKGAFERCNILDTKVKSKLGKKNNIRVKKSSYTTCSGKLFSNHISNSTTGYKPCASLRKLAGENDGILY